RQLAENLQTNVESLDQFVLSNFVHYQLLDWMDHDRLSCTAVGGMLEEDEVAALGEKVNRAAETSVASRTNRWLRSWGAVAATLLVAATLGTLGYMMASRPDYVGLLSDA